MTQRKKRTRKHRNKQKTGSYLLDSTKLFLIFTGTILILFGIFIGDVNVLSLTINSAIFVLLGFFLQSLSILIFVKQKQLKNNNG